VRIFSRASRPAPECRTASAPGAGRRRSGQDELTTRIRGVDRPPDRVPQHRVELPLVEQARALALEY